MALEGSQVHHQKQGPLATGNVGGDLVGGAVGGPASGITNFCTSGGIFPPFQLRGIPVPAELTYSPFANKLVDLDYRCRVPHGWQRCLNLKSGKIFFKDLLTEDDEEQDDDAGDMSRRGKSPKLDLRLNLSSTHRGGFSEAAGRGAGSSSNRSNSPNSSSSSSSSTTPSSCLSSETEQGRFSSSPEATSMVLVGCPRCLMYVMLAEDDPRCPKCKSTVLLDFLKDPRNAVSAKRTRNN